MRLIQKASLIYYLFIIITFQQRADEDIEDRCGLKKNPLCEKTLFTAGANAESEIFLSASYRKRRIDLLLALLKTKLFYFWGGRFILVAPLCYTYRAVFHYSL